MIKKINSIKNLGVFSDFRWDSQSCCDFKRYNFIYGWNYSGKTSLSRLFRCLEAKKDHQDYPDLNFDIETDNGSIRENAIANNNLILKVYNEEFVEENFKWNDENHRINPVLILGKESIELMKKLKENEELKTKKENKKKEIEKEKRSLENELQNSLTNKSSEIRNILSITNSKDFDRRVLEERIDEIINNYKDFILTDIDKQAKLNVYRSSTTYEEINKISVDFKLENFTKNVNTILSKSISAQQVIEKLKNNPELNQWVWQGMNLHRDETKCQFCGNDLPSDLFERLKKHFSKEFNELITQITTVKNEITTYKNNLNRIQFPDKARFYSEYQNEYEEILNELKESIGKIDNELEKLLNALQEKRNKPFDELSTIEISNVEKETEQKLKELNEIIDKNNKKVKDLSNEKQNFKKDLLTHYSAKAVDELKYFEKKKEIEDYVNKLNAFQAEFDVIDKEIKQINEQISKSNIGAEKINKYLTDFFADDQLKLQSLDDGTYQIYRNDRIAKNLSTGEKNIIALVYFITRLEENNFNINDAIILIDDPVSSLDSNHTYKVYGFLSEKVLGCKQLFITTHNFDFFNLLKDLVKGDPEGTPNRQNKNQKENYYLIKKILKEGSQKQSIIENLPNVLRKFKSEYNYLFSILKEFNNSDDKSNFKLLYLIPNIARRFLESYLFQKYPDGRKFKDKCSSFFDGVDISNKTSTLKIIDEYSHEENPEHATKFPDIQEVEKCVKIILELICQKDKEHFDALCNSLKN